MNKFERPLTLEEQKAFFETHADPGDRLAYLAQSKVVGYVLDNVFTPKDLDNAYQNLRKRVQELEHIRLLDSSTIVELQRQIELLVMGDAV